VLLAAALPVPQVVDQIHPPSPGPHSLRGMYGEARRVELDEIAHNPENYQRKNVATRGFLEPLQGREYWSLSMGISRVLLVPGEGSFTGELEGFVGRRVEVTGIVRLLKNCDNEPPCRIGPCTLCEDPELPPLPNPRTDWPRVSITILSLSELPDTGAERRDQVGSGLEDIFADPAAAVGREVRVVGQFRGRNLFGDLPADSQRDPDDWVLKQGERAVWVTGKKPRGKGWSLDPRLESDSRWWLEVEGSVEVAGGVVYIRAQRVNLAKPAP
jgi:hypothetical protein